MPEFKLGLLAGGVSLEKKGGGGGGGKAACFFKMFKSNFYFVLGII
jgi:hypothetical protein